MIRSADLVGTPTVLALWSTDCCKSRQALDALKILRRDYEPRGVQFVLIANDEKPALVRAVLDSADVVFPAAYASGDLARRFDPHYRFPWSTDFALPSVLVLGTDGRVVGRAPGIPLEEWERNRVELSHVRALLERMPLARQVTAGPT
jgi:hypothetical protein